MTSFQLSRRQWWTLAVSGLLPVVIGSELIVGRVLLFAVQDIESSGATLIIAAIGIAIGIGFALYGFLLVSPSALSIIAVLPVTVGILALELPVAVSERTTGPIAVASLAVLFLLQIGEIIAKRKTRTAT